MFILLAIVFVLSTLDGALTVYEMESGFIKEMNFVMAPLLQASPILFMAVKVLIMVGAIYTLWKFRYSFFAKLAAWGALVLYAVVIYWHVHNLLYIHTS